MSPGSEVLSEVLSKYERETNRSCAVVALIVAVFVGIVSVIGYSGAWFIESRWMTFYLAVIVAPLLAVVGYARLRRYEGAEIKYLMVGASALVPAAMAVPTVFGFFIMALPLAVACRYFQSHLVLVAYAIDILVTVVISYPHSLYGIPCVGLVESSRETILAFFDGAFDRQAYWEALLAWCAPSMTILHLAFVITSLFVCRGHWRQLNDQARLLERLADVEKGLAIAATQSVMLQASAGAAVDVSEIAKKPNVPQPDVKGWSTAAISDCIIACKKRAETDAAFAALVERDPAEAVRVIRSAS